MRFLAILAFLPNLSLAAEDCPYRGREEELKARVAASSAILARRPNSTDITIGTAFLVRSVRGVELVSARHVAPIPQPGEGGDGCASQIARGPQPSDHLLGPLELWPPLGESDDSSRVLFKVESGDYNASDDGIKCRRGPDCPFRSGAPALELAAHDYAPTPGQTELFITGFPTEYFQGFGGENFHAYRCLFLGYAPNLGGDAAALLLDCDISFRNGGMSGGAIVDACSGAVVGLTTGQFYDETCAPKGNPRRVLAGIVAADRDGSAAFGVQRPIKDSVCFKYADGGFSTTPMECSLTPGLSWQRQAIP